mmetsp:Transcript_12546/g.35930  ORF Transcript_12546/g.35930 Transcript_12546/m.35930 type:complete len:298 (-) Transcript_12546:1000-1893(-)
MELLVLQLHRGLELGAELPLGAYLLSDLQDLRSQLRLGKRPLLLLESGPRRGRVSSSDGLELRDPRLQGRMRLDARGLGAKEVGLTLELGTIGLGIQHVAEGGHLVGKLGASLLLLSPRRLEGAERVEYPLEFRAAVGQGYNCAVHAAHLRAVLPHCLAHVVDLRLAHRHPVQQLLHLDHGGLNIAGLEHLPFGSGPEGRLQLSQSVRQCHKLGCEACRLLGDAGLRSPHLRKSAGLRLPSADAPRELLQSRGQRPRRLVTPGAELHGLPLQRVDTLQDGSVLRLPLPQVRRQLVVR